MYQVKLCINNSWEVEKEYTTKGEARQRARDIISFNHIKTSENKSWFEIFDNGKMIYKSTLQGYRNKFVINFMGIKGF